MEENNRLIVSLEKAPAFIIDENGRVVVNISASIAYDDTNDRWKAYVENMPAFVFDNDGYVMVAVKRDPQEQATYEGIRFIGTDLFTSLANGDAKYYFVDFSSVTKLIEFYDFNLSVDGQAIVHVYKNPDISDKGTEISIMNANVKSEITNQLKIYADPTISSNGTEIMKTYVASGSRGDRVMKEVFSYRILGEDMLIGIENVSGSSMAYGSVIFDWKEVE